MTGSATVRLPREGDHTDFRRQQLIDAAMSSIAEHGIANTTVSRVAEAAGLSQGIVNFYFENKRALLMATLEYVESEFQRVRRDTKWSAAKTPEAQLDAIIEATFDPAVCNSALPGRLERLLGRGPRSGRLQPGLLGARDLPT